MTTQKNPSDFVPGYHGVWESLSSDVVRVREVWVGEGKGSPRTTAVLDLAQKKGIPVIRKKGAELAQRFPGIVHQGLVAVIEPFGYADLEKTLHEAPRSSGWGLFIVADHITDEGNLGSLIRTGAFFNADALILPKDRSAGMTPGVLKRASGSHAALPVVRVVNLGRTLERLGDAGYWIIGASGDGPETIYAFDWRRDVVLVVGNERKGLSPGVRKKCHLVVRIPSGGAIRALNVAVAAGAVLSEITRQRLALSEKVSDNSRSLER